MIRYVPFHDARKWQREGHRTRDAHVLLELLRRWGPSRMVVLNRPTCLAEALNLGGRWRTKGTAIKRQARGQLTATPEGYVAADCLHLELGFRRWSFHVWLAQAYGSECYCGAVAGLVGAADAGDVLWLCHPFAAGVLQWERRARAVVDAFDNFAIHPELNSRARRAAVAGYRVLADRAEQITVNSAALQSFLWSTFRRESVVVPNGVDRQLFATAPPMHLPRIARPVIGYAGKLGRRLDLELIRALSSSLTEGSILFAGPVLNWRWVRPALALPHVRYLGDLHYRDVPAFLAACDVCIVPHRAGDGENAGDPTKIYEYLAAGKPVVTAAIEGTGAFEGRITIAGTTEAFIEATLAAARGERVPRGALLDEETWEARTRAICSHFGLDD
jgi:teichuronic acid biosynthesis glycosyltransferase TuaH